MTVALDSQTGDTRCCVDELRTQIEELHEDAFVWAVACCDGDLEEAEDVLQLSYLKLMDGRAKFSGRSAFKTFLFGVVRNTARERRRRRKVRRFLLFQWGGEERSAPASPVDSIEQTELRAQVLEAMSSLSDRQREVVELVFYHDLSVEEASEVMDVSVGTARTHYHRGKKALAERLDALRDDDEERLAHAG